MEHIEFLGTSGTRTRTDGTTCLRVSRHCVIDAGNLINGVENNALSIDHVFLTHSHLDHIVDLPFLADLFVTQKATPLNIYGLASTLEDLRSSIFNDRVWPDFGSIDLIGHPYKTINFIEIEVDRPYTVDGVTLTPFKTNHTEGSCGYMIEKNGSGIIFSGDTYCCDRIWELIDANAHIHTLVTEISFPSSYAKLARESKHLTPALLADEIKKSSRRDYTLHVMHLKTLFTAPIIEELMHLNLLQNGGKVLHDNDVVPYRDNGV